MASKKTYHFTYHNGIPDPDNDDWKDVIADQSVQNLVKHGRRISISIAATILIVIIIGLLYTFNVIPHRAYTNADFNIPDYKSQIDQDHDGIDDQTDILNSTRDYLATKPKYQSIYYNSGYPDDNHGVCTDVVAFALKGAGYDLMELVDQDIRKYPEWYDVDAPDKNIDFRRVKNLEVWLRHHAQSLSTNLNDIYEWQGGDIVVFKDHIGIVSDRRNKDGVPFLIHHYSPVQPSYEEDALGRYEILGHYRIS